MSLMVRSAGPPHPLSATTNSAATAASQRLAVALQQSQRVGTADGVQIVAKALSAALLAARGVPHTSLVSCRSWSELARQLGQAIHSGAASSILTDVARRDMGQAKSISNAAIRIAALSFSEEDPLTLDELHGLLLGDDGDTIQASPLVLCPHAGASLMAAAWLRNNPPAVWQRRSEDTLEWLLAPVGADPTAMVMRLDCVFQVFAALMDAAVGAAACSDSTATHASLLSDMDALIDHVVSPRLLSVDVVPLPSSDNSMSPVRVVGRLRSHLSDSKRQAAYLQEQREQTARYLAPSPTAAQPSPAAKALSPIHAAPLPTPHTSSISAAPPARSSLVAQPPPPSSSWQHTWNAIVRWLGATTPTQRATFAGSLLALASIWLLWVVMRRRHARLPALGSAPALRNPPPPARNVLVL